MDEKLLLLINREWTSPALDLFMATMSSFAAWLPVFVIAGVVFAFRGSFRSRAFLVAVLASIGLSDGIVARSLKRVADRPRPHQTLHDIRVVELERATPRIFGVFHPPRIKLSRPSPEEVDGRSFPSAHTMNTTSAAIVAFAFFGWRASWAFLIAAAVSYSRIYTGSHWPSDVIVSVLLAMGLMFFYLAGIEWAWRKWAPRFAPTLAARHPTLFAA